MDQETKEHFVSLRNIMNEECIRKFDKELSRVLRNIMDPDTGDNARDITLKTKIIPGKTSRKKCSVKMQCFSKLAKTEALETEILIVVDGDEVNAKEIIQDKFKIGDDGAMSDGQKGPEKKTPGAKRKVKDEQAGAGQEATQ